MQYSAVQYVQEHCTVLYVWMAAERCSRHSDLGPAAESHRPQCIGLLLVRTRVETLPAAAATAFTRFLKCNVLVIVHFTTVLCAVSRGIPLQHETTPLLMLTLKSTDNEE